MERDDGQELAELTVRACEYCGGPVPKRRKDARFCSTSHRVMASRKRKREREIHDSLVTRGLTDHTLMELHDQAAPPRDWRDDPRNFSDFGELPDDYEMAAEIDERDARYHAMFEQDEERRRPKFLDWFGLKQRYSQNPGVELAEITREKAERYQADQARVKNNLRNSTRQPQDRHNPVTKDVVATRATESRKLNRVFTTTDPRPVWQAQEFSLQAEQATWDGFSSGRSSGHRPKHADYAWDLGTTGFIN